MSLDVYLEVGEESVYEANITHNLNLMADQAGLYKALWRPEELGIVQAGELVAPLSLGLAVLKRAPARLYQFDPKNGWGSYEGLVKFVEAYLDACREHPDATVMVSR